MSKLKLDLEALAVETFATTPGDGRRGTVHGALAGTADTPAEDTGCTAPCMSGDSMCWIVSCGSTCEAGGCDVGVHHVD